MRPPGRLVIGGSAIAHHLIEVEMEVAGDDLEAGNRLENVVVGISKHLFLSGLVTLGLR
jgi:hypothetical protein